MGSPYASTRKNKSPKENNFITGVFPERISANIQGTNRRNKRSFFEEFII